MVLLSSRSAHLCNDSVNRMPPPLLLGPPDCLKKESTAQFVFAQILQEPFLLVAAASFFLIPPFAAGERDLSSSNLPFPHFSPPPLVPRPPSSTHAVMRWKISAVNLSVYGFAIVATPRTRVFFLQVVLLGWITDFSFFLLF